jgi:hypothetical protein
MSALGQERPFAKGRFAPEPDVTPGWQLVRDGKLLRAWSRICELAISAVG